MPSKQCFDTVNAFGREVYLWLVVQLKCLIGNGPAKLARDCQPANAVVILFRAVIFKTSTIAFCDVHGDVRLLEQGLSVFRILGKQCDTDTKTHVNGDAACFNRFLQTFDEFFRQLRDVIDTRKPVDNKGELITADSCNETTVLSDTGKAASYLVQNIVTNIVAEGVIDLFESIEVDHHQRDRFMIALSCKPGVKMCRERRAVWQSSQRVVCGLKLQLPELCLSLADITNDCGIQVLVIQLHTAD